MLIQKQNIRGNLQLQIDVIMKCLAQLGLRARVGELARLCNTILRRGESTDPRRWRDTINKLGTRDGMPFKVVDGIVFVADDDTPHSPPQFQSTLIDSTSVTNICNISKSEEGVRVIIPNGDDHIPRGVPHVIKTEYTRLISDALDTAYETGFCVAFRGPKGTAKTQTVMFWAQEHRVPVIVVDCSEGLKERHLQGTWGETPQGLAFTIGPIPQAFELANRYGHCLLLFEEVNALNPHIQKNLNSLLDWRHNYYVPSISKTFRLKDGAKLICVANMNPTSHGGTFDLNEDFMSRWSIYNVSYPKKREEEKILTEILSEYPEVHPWIPKFVILATETRHGKTKGWPYALSTRDVVRILINFAVNLRRKGEVFAMKMANAEFLGCFTDENFHETASKRFLEILGGTDRPQDDKDNKQQNQ